MTQEGNKGQIKENVFYVLYINCTFTPTLCPIVHQQRLLFLKKIMKFIFTADILKDLYCHSVWSQILIYCYTNIAS